jgi:hypothetical protein
VVPVESCCREGCFCGGRPSQDEVCCPASAEQDWCVTRALNLNLLQVRVQGVDLAQVLICPLKHLILWKSNCSSRGLAAVEWRLLRSLDTGSTTTPPPPCTKRLL